MRGDQLSVRPALPLSGLPIVGRSQGMSCAVLKALFLVGLPESCRYLPENLAFHRFAVEET
jgi:hypothetical protein